MRPSAPKPSARIRSHADNVRPAIPASLRSGWRPSYRQVVFGGEAKPAVAAFEHVHFGLPGHSWEAAHQVHRLLAVRAGRVLHLWENATQARSFTRVASWGRLLAANTDV